MELFFMEHKKLWKKASVRISVFLCIIYVVLFGSILSYQWFSFGTQFDYSSTFNSKLDGYENIRYRQNYAAKWGGTLTDETLQKITKDYQKKYLNNDVAELNRTDWKIVNSFLETLWPELKSPDSDRLMISYVKPEKLTGFYERRNQKLKEFLDMNGQKAGHNCLLI